MTDKCPFTGDMKNFQNRYQEEGTSNKDWWPNRVNLKILEQHSEKVNPFHKEFNYAEEFKKINLKELKEDLYQLMTDSKEWWPADYGHYGPFFIRMAWHSAGTYRLLDGRGGAGTGNQRFAPLNSWPDNANLDKARRLLWPIKKKYGKSLSWADLIILAGTCALESMGVKTIGFAGGREDIWEPEEDIFWGIEKEWLGENRYNDDNKLQGPLSSVQMGLIYVNPEGPHGVPDAVGSAKDVRETFQRMGMTDEETVALIAGGHTFGKCHGAVPQTYLGPEPEASNVEDMGLGWKNSYGTGFGDDTYTSGIEGPWNSTPTKWDMGYLNNLFDYDWNLVKSPAGAWQWVPADEKAHNAPMAHDSNKVQAPIMTTADLSLRMDPIYKEIALKYKNDIDLFEKDFAKAWFKLTHRDMGPKSRYLGSEVPVEDFIWQDPIPKLVDEPINSDDEKLLKEKINQLDIPLRDLIATAWKSASTYRNSDMRGGANGSRLRLLPQRDWEVNEPEKLGKILSQFEKIVAEFNETSQRKVSIADLIVLAGNYGIELAAKKNDIELKVPFLSGRTDAIQEQTDILGMAVLEPIGDGFVNYKKSNIDFNVVDQLIDKSQLLGLNVYEMVALLGGLRVLGINHQENNYGVLTENVGTLSTDFFVNLLDMNNVWSPIDEDRYLFEAKDRISGEVRWQATTVDLIFGSNAQLRAIVEVYASDDGLEKFLNDFVNAWNKVMNADRFDVN